MWVKFITAPLVGGLIGLVTNGIAIKMIFRPLRPVYIGKYKLPFTPGLIPKERSRIAKAIGDVVSNDLLNRDTLKNTLLSETMKNQISQKIDNAILRYNKSDDTVSTVLGRLVPGDKIDEKLSRAKRDLAATVTRKAIEQDIGSAIIDYAYEEIISKTKPVLRNLTSTALSSLKQPFALKINNMIKEKSQPVVEKFLDEQASEILNMPIKVMLATNQEKIPHIKEDIWRVFVDIVNTRLDSILETVDISAIINDKINQLDLLELEGIIMTLIKKELNALIYLGGLLGLIMGFLNIAFDFLL